MNHDVKKMYENIENRKIPTIIGIKKNISGRVRKKVNSTFHEAISLTSFLATREYKNVKIKKVRNGTYIITPIKSNKSISTAKIWTVSPKGS